MNYGKFFRLNKHLSRIEDGFAIYDYIDLPAYFTPSKDNLMSPKYPISVMVLGDSVVFKLHYSAYKIEKVSKQDAQDESIKGYSNYPQYIYNIEAPSLISENKVKGGDTTKIVHMEEIILELPFTDTVGRSLSDTIRDIYDTQFPLIQRDNGKDSDLSSKEKSSGGRYLEKLIRTRYLEEKVDEVKDVNSHFYESLRKISDGTASYSTLWLMGLVKGDKNDVRYRRTDKKGNVIGFLRKLLLDFMFDLKHSDVFQNSANYQKMYSGLMSDFYFSALMHKCEYYYYRKLTREAIDEIEDGGIDKKTRKQRKESIKVLYANELVKAEDLWVQDIMNPQAEKDFEHRYPGKSKIRREIFGGYSFQQWPSWFAEPEEEMRRVCFTMKEDNTGEKHICNADTLIRYLGLNKNSEDQMETNMIDLRDNEKEQISRWFLKHYAFSDVLHLHLFRHANLFFLLFLALPVLISWFTRISLPIVFLCDFIIFLVPCAVFFIHYYNCKSCGLETCHRRALNCTHYVHPESTIVKTRKEIVRRKRWWTIVFVLLAFAFVWIGQCSCINEMIKDFHEEYPIPTFIIILVIITLVIFVLARRLIISVLHLFLPRLVASITLAWFTLSMGFDLYVSYFDSIPSLPYIIGICAIVLFFVVYSINLVIPHSPTLRKFIRGAELMVISYIISLFVGFVIINFLGEKYLERGGYIGDYYEQHVYIDKSGDSTFVDSPKTDSSLFVNTSSDTCLRDSIQTIYKILCNMDTAAHTTESHMKSVDNLQMIKMKNREYKIAAKIDFWGTDIFILRDFLIMFAFIAMFTGIFIQLIIFGDNKQMTEL